MIIFDLDGTLADCEHRRHLINPEEYPDLCEYSNYYIDKQTNNPVVDLQGKASWRYKSSGKPFIVGWKSFYEACDKDKPIEPVIELWDQQISLGMMGVHQIWSSRCESVRSKTEKWLENHLLCFDSSQLKMRPIGDNTPDDELKERWLDEAIEQGKTIDFVFDDRPKVVRMWRRKGIFVFYVNQTGKEF